MPLSILRRATANFWISCVRIAAADIAGILVKALATCEAISCKKPLQSVNVYAETETDAKVLFNNRIRAVAYQMEPTVESA